MTIIETIARALSDDPMVHTVPVDRLRTKWCWTAAQAALTALTEAGYAIVPIEPSIEQHMAMHAVVLDPDWRAPYVSEIYAAAIASAPDHIMPPIQEPGPLESGEGE